MPTRKPIVLGELISGTGSALDRLSQRAACMDELTGSIRGALPDPIRPHLIGANLRDDRLVLIADSAVWAARLRFYAPEVLKYMATRHSSSIEKLQVKVRPPATDT